MTTGVLLNGTVMSAPSRSVAASHPSRADDAELRGGLRDVALAHRRFGYRRLRFTVEAVMRSVRASDCSIGHCRGALFCRGEGLLLTVNTPPKSC